MSHLFSEPFIQHLLQLIVGAVCFLLFAISAAVVIVVGLHAYGMLDGETLRAATLPFKILAFPFKGTLAPILVPLAGIIPVVFANVLFNTNASKDPPAQELNRVGKIIVVLMILGLLAGIAAVIAFHIFDRHFNFLAGENKPQAQAAITALITLQAIYLAQLLGLKPK